MIVIRLTQPNGNIREFPIGVAFRRMPDEILTVLGQPDPPVTHKGLGDVVAKVTTAIGIKPCEGCKQRQEALNNWWFKLANSLGK